MLVRWSTLVSRTLTTTRTFEEITIFIAWVASIAASLILLPNVRGVTGAGLAILMIAIAVIDARRFIIPDELTVAALALGFLHAAIQGADFIVDALVGAAFRGAVLAFAFLSLQVLYRRIRGREGIGLGDVEPQDITGCGLIGRRSRFRWRLPRWGPSQFMPRDVYIRDGLSAGRSGCRSASSLRLQFGLAGSWNRHSSYFHPRCRYNKLGENVRIGFVGEACGRAAGLRQGARGLWIRITAGELNMGKAVKLFTAALALWLSAAPCANSAGLSEGRTKNGRGYGVASVRAARLSALQRSARADAFVGTRTQHVDVRMVAATNRNLEQMVGDKQFREDLYFRLNVFPVRIPPLRERAGDIPLLVHHYVDNYAQRMNKRIETISEEAMAALCRHSWPGNIRELQNFIERAVILTPGSILQIQVSDLERSTPITSTTANTLEDMEREHILQTLRETGGIVGGRHGAALRLGLKRTTLLSKMERLGISRKYTLSIEKDEPKELAR